MTTTTDIGPRKTMFVLVIVVGCFAVLWPKIFYPMLVGNIHHPHITPTDGSGCCDIIWENDVNAIKMITHLCETILDDDATKKDPRVKLAFETGRLTATIVNTCRQKVWATCHVDISAFLTENIRLGKTYRQMVDELRSTNTSLCLKTNFGVWEEIGRTHKVLELDVDDIRQERPPHLRQDVPHPALRERGRAIPSMPQKTSGRPVPKLVPGTPGPIPGMRPTLGGAGHVVPPPKQTSYNSMGLIMPVYTIGIIMFFLYTLMKVMLKVSIFVLFSSFSVTKVLCKLGMALYFVYQILEIMFKKPSSTLHSDDSYYHSTYANYSNQNYERDEVHTNGLNGLNGVNGRNSHQNGSTKLGDLEIDQLRRRLQETERAMTRIIAQMGSGPPRAPRAQTPPTALDDDFCDASVKNLTSRLEYKFALNKLAREDDEPAHEPKRVVQFVEERDERDVDDEVVKQTIDDIMQEACETVESQREEGEEVNDEEEEKETEIQVESNMSNINDMSINQESNETTNDDDTTTIKVLGVEISESCEGGLKWSRPGSPVSVAPPVRLSPPRTPEPPPAIYLHGKVPAKSDILVSTSEIEQLFSDDDNDDLDEPAIMLSGKVTLSVIPKHVDVKKDQKLTEVENVGDSDDDGDESKYVTVSATTEAVMDALMKKPLNDGGDSGEELDDDAIEFDE